MFAVACLPQTLWRLTCAIVCSAGLAGSAWAWQGVVTHVSDGDTLTVRQRGDKPPEKVRLQGLDAPEICQEGGEAARAALARRVLKQQVTVQPKARDRYGRLVATVRVGGQDVGALQVQDGHAWSEGYRGRPARYHAEQAQAQQAKRGLFAQRQPQRPRDFRREHGSCYPRNGS